MISIYSAVLCIIFMIYYKINYQHHVGYIKFHFPDEDLPMKWYHDYDSTPFRILRYVGTVCMLGLLAYSIIQLRRGR